MNKCRCCFHGLSSELFSAKIFNRDIKYFDCTNCGYVETEYPYWLDEAYASVIDNVDTGIMSRNLSNVSLVLSTLIMMKKKSSLVVDFAGGYGLLVRLLRDIGINALWSDPYCENLVARGFEYTGNKQSDLVTAFESFEHFVIPSDEVTKLLNISPNILFTTYIISDPAPKPSDWWYYSLKSGQHIGFYRLRTLQYIADKFDLYLISDGVSKHFFSKKKYSFTYWCILFYITRKFPKLSRMGMSSKTWEDYLLISNNKS